MLRKCHVLTVHYNGSNIPSVTTASALKISQGITFRHKPGVFQISDCAGNQNECNFVFLQPFGSPGYKSCWFSKPAIMPTPLPGAGSPCWVGTPHSS